MLDTEIKRKLKNQKMTYYIEIVICFMGSLTSIFFPYLEKVNIYGGNLDLPKSVPGYEFDIIPFIFFTFLIALLINAKWSFFVSIITLGLVYLTRTAIHYQGFIDHDYDSKSGLGYYLLFTFSIIFFLASTINWIRIVWLKRKAAPNTRLAQEPEFLETQKD